MTVRVTVRETVTVTVTFRVILKVRETITVNVKIADACSSILALLVLLRCHPEIVLLSVF